MAVKVANPVLALVAWTVCLAMLVATAILASAPVLGATRAVLAAPHPLVGKVAVVAGLGVTALALVAFFIWLFVALIGAVRAGRRAPTGR